MDVSHEHAEKCKNGGKIMRGSYHWYGTVPVTGNIPVTSGNQMTDWHSLEGMFGTRVRREYVG
jgi:hypothetical protein